MARREEEFAVRFSRVILKRSTETHGTDCDDQKQAKQRRFFVPMRPEPHIFLPIMVDHQKTADHKKWERREIKSCAESHNLHHRKIIEKCEHDGNEKHDAEFKRFFRNEYDGHDNERKRIAQKFKKI